MKAVLWLVRLEIGIWKSLGLLALRRTAGKGPDDEAFPYIGHLGLVLFGFIFASCVELPVFHVIIPWEKVRLAVDVVSIWGLVWMFGYAASLKVFPHLVGREVLRVRNGAHTEIVIPWSDVESVSAKRRDAEKDRLHVVDGVALLPLLKETNVEVTLVRPMIVRDEQVTEVRFHVDDTGAFTTAARARLEARAG